MDRDDDIAASLPRPPQPAPARREAAIAEALRRFDGGEARPTAAAGSGLGAGPAPWRTRFNRPYAGALAGAFLVAAIALPLAWTALPDAARDGVREGPAASLGEDAKPGPAMADSEPAASPQEPGDPSAEPSPAADAAPVPPGPAAGAPPPGPAIREDERSAGPGEAALPDAGASGDVVVTGSRIARPNLESASPVAVVGGQDVTVTGTRSARAAPRRRGDWNACTIDDPARDLGACRSLVNPAAKGSAGRAAAAVADGLARAWQGDLDEATAAFDRAIAIAPRSSIAYLNRGLAWRRRGDLDKALADLDRAVRFAPRAARGYFNRSLVLHQRGDSKRALADEQRAAELDPRYAPLAGPNR